MAFRSLNQVLKTLEYQPSPRERRLQKIQLHWLEIVGPVVAAQTLPVKLYRGVLQVATASSAWAQNLVFERQRLMEKLNQALSLELVDIRFSTAQWHTSAASTPLQEADPVDHLWQEHPSRIEVNHLDGVEPASESDRTAPDTPAKITAKEAFERWSRVMRSRSRQLPLCPRCHCPTPPGELERWQVCALCAPQQWQSLWRG